LPLADLLPNHLFSAHKVLSLSVGNVGYLCPLQSLLSLQLENHIVNVRLVPYPTRLSLPAGIQLHIDRHHASEVAGGGERITKLRAEEHLELTLGHGTVRH
jgi:hypothetical protein